MAKAAARLRDMCTGHGSYPPRPNCQGSPDVFYNGLPAHRKTDAWIVHCHHSCHTGILASGSPTVFTNGLAQGRVGDSVNCGSRVANGSPDVFVGEDRVSGPCTNAPTKTVGVADNIDPNEPTVDGIPVGKDGSLGGTQAYYGAPGGGGVVGGTSGSGGSYANAGSQYATGTNYTPKMASTAGAKGLGSISARYESNGNPGAVVQPDVNGTNSYGKYQINVKTGTMNNFMKYEQVNNPDAYNKLMAAGGGTEAGQNSPEFVSAWKDLSSSDSSFGDDQDGFIKSTHYDVAAANIQNSTGLDINTRSKAVQDAVWSTSVQNGPNSKVFTNALAGKDVNNMSDAQIVNALYDERGATNANGSLKYFSSSSASVQNSIKNRYTNERQDVLAEIPS